MGVDVSGPLQGLRVVEVAGIGPAPFACMLLDQLGADILRVERPHGSRFAGAPPAGADTDRPFITLDLKSADGKSGFLDLAAKADVVVEGMRPGVMEKLGIGPQVCLVRNAALIFARMTGWGQGGPLAQDPGHDINYAALTGALHAVGSQDKPMVPLNLVADFGGGAMYLIAGILAALYERQSSGLGQVLDVAMVDGAASLLSVVYDRFATGFWRDERRANLLDGGAPFYDTYECRDGRFVAVGAIEPQFFAVLVDKLGVAAKLHGDRLDRANWDEHRQVFADAFAERSRDEWAALFAGSDACVAPVLSLAEAPHHPHLRGRGTFVEVDGAARPGPAPRFSRTPGGVGAESRHAQNVAETLSSWSFTAAQISDLLTLTSTNNSAPRPI
jgi:alpha-methylacyl-CoA racemase